jgi:hypothetical protein
MRAIDAAAYAIESYKYLDISQLWARERLVHEVIVARELARGIVREGLRFQSVNPKFVKAQEVFRGYPYVGYTARPGMKPIILKAESLEHLLAVAREATDPDFRVLSSEFVTKSDFRDWLVHTGRALPAFWFSSNERAEA